MKRIYCQIDKCLACRSCELACAIVHSTSKDLVKAISETPLPMRFIQVEAVDRNKSLNHQPIGGSIAMQCRQCEEPDCVKACISGGMYIDEKSGNIVINPDKCVACWSCVMVCQFGVIVRHEGLHKALKCDQCPDLETPACVKACPTKALQYTEQFEIEKASI
jgi:anaerobic carbon-monoxide dehydrogenase iron sulfur subunit